MRLLQEPLTSEIDPRHDGTPWFLGVNDQKMSSRNLEA